MNVFTKDSASVSQAEQERRIAEYRRLGFERKAAAQVVYHESAIVCPWPGCGQQIEGIHFKLDEWVESAKRLELFEAWWKGPGLVGRCPKCRNFVQFSITGKTKVEDPAGLASRLLPDDWHCHAHLVMRS